MADEHIIGPSEFSSCELVVKIDGNTLNIPINFHMSDSEVRKLYPHLLEVARVEENPMTDFLARKAAGEFSNLSEDEYADVLSKTEKLARYWYDRPATSLLDVGIGIALDMAIRNKKIDVDTFLDKKAEIDTMYDPSVAETEASSVSESEADSIEKKYNIKSDKDGRLTLHDEIAPHDAIGGDVFDLYGDNGACDFVSEKLAELEKRHDINRLADIVEKDEFAEDTYASTYDPTKPLDMGQVKDNGLLDIYGSDTHNVFDDLDNTSDVASDSSSDSDHDDSQEEHETVQSVEDAMADMLDDDQCDEPDESPYYDGDDFEPADLCENIDNDEDEGV